MEKEPAFNFNLLLQDNIQDKHHKVSDSVYNNIVEFLNCLEGYKTRIKNLHWSSSNINIHIQLDELLETIDSYQDNLAEETMGIFTQFTPNILNGVQSNISSPMVLLCDIIDKTLMFYKSISDDICYAGIRSETETLIHDLHKYKYLFNLCK